MGQGQAGVAMNALEASNYIGKEGSIFIQGLIVLVRIKDVKVEWGRPRFLVSPVAGGGEAWRESVVVLP